MASGRMFGKPMAMEEYFLDIVFEGIVQSSDCAKLIIELLKYIAYQRQQIPLSFDQLKKDVLQDDLMRSTQDVTNRSRKYRNLLEAKKRQAAVAALEELFQTIEQAFAEAGPVKEVAILLGSTIVSPKETIVIRFPVQFYDGPILGFKSCLHTMFRRLVSADFLSEAKLRHCSHLNVLLLAPRHMSCDRLVHQPMLKPAPRGQRFVLTFDYAGTVAPAELSRLEEAAEMDISGIEPFATDASNHDGEYTCTATTPSSCLRSVAKDSSENVSRPRSVADTDENDTEYIWYRIPVTVKGYRDKTTKMSSDRSVCS